MKVKMLRSLGLNEYRKLKVKLPDCKELVEHAEVDVDGDAADELVKYGLAKRIGQPEKTIRTYPKSSPVKGVSDDK